MLDQIQQKSAEFELQMSYFLPVGSRKDMARMSSLDAGTIDQCMDAVPSFKDCRYQLLCLFCRRKVRGEYRHSALETLLNL